MNKPLATWGAVGLLLPVLAGLVFLVLLMPYAGFPSEDAAILFQYSETLTDHGIIAYHPQQPPAEGATDFLWMILIALAYRLGISSFLFANLLSAGALLGTAFLLTRLARESLPPQPDARRLFPAMFFAIALFLMLLPPFFAAALGFSPYAFGFLITLCVWYFLHENAWGLALSTLATCLLRPDGVVFTVPLFAAFLLMDRAKRKHRFTAGLLAAALPGMAYFLWRYSYFGLPLPLPFYVKSHFDRYLLIFNQDSLMTNLRFAAAVLPFILMAMFPSSSPAFPRSKRVTVLITTLLVPLLFYSCMNLEQNIAYRFQYPFALIGLLLGVLGLSAEKKRVCSLIAAILWCLALTAPWYLMEGYRTLCTPTENMPRLAQKLGALSTPGRIATTEAGRLPYYSRWETMDLWGLNTPALARRVVTPDDLTAFAPDLIVLHTSGDYYGDDWRFLTSTNLILHTDRSWSNMVENTVLAARQTGCTLFMVPHRLPEQADPFSARLAALRPRINQAMNHQGSFDTYYAFLIRNNSPLYAELVALLRQQGAITYEQYQEDKERFIAQATHQASP